MGRKPKPNPPRKARYVPKAESEAKFMKGQSGAKSASPPRSDEEPLAAPATDAEPALTGAASVLNP